MGNEDNLRQARLFHELNDAVFLFELTEEGLPGRFLEVNEAACRMLNYSRQELLGMSLVDVEAREDRDGLPAIIEDLLARGSVTGERTCGTRDGHRLPVEVSARLIYMSGKRAVLCVVRTNGRRTRMEGDLYRYRLLFKHNRDIVVFVREDGTIEEVNDAAEKAYGYSRSEMLEKDFSTFSASGVPFPNGAKVKEKGQDNAGVIIETEHRRKDGSIFPVEVSCREVQIDGEYFRYYIIRDISERFCDPLTGLCNRPFFESELARLDRDGLRPVGIIVCDVDGLKAVNDTLGHDKGDRLLTATACIIQNCFHREDLVARVGGDEFAALLPQKNREAVERVVGQIKEHISQYNAAGPDLSLHVSLGFAVTSDASTTMKDLFREADNNMYREKLHRSRSSRSGAVQVLATAMEARDFITEGHGGRMEKLVETLAAAVGLSGTRITDLRLLARFHDIGKVGIPDQILFKPGPLTRGEMGLMRRHCEIGHRIALSAPDLAPIADWILKHHEWWNGRGYPLGLRGEDVPVECRILTICDAYDAMTSDRPYRKAMFHDEAVGELERCAGDQFDPALVQEFTAIMEMKKHEDA